MGLRENLFNPPVNAVLFVPELDLSTQPNYLRGADGKILCRNNNNNNLEIIIKMFQIIFLK